MELNTWLKKAWEVSKGAEKVGEKLIDGGFSFFGSEYSRYKSLEEQLARLRSTVQSINALLTDAEERREITDDTVMLWLGRLKSVAFDADDLLDSHQTALAVYKKGKRSRESQSQSGQGSSKKRKRFPVELPLSIPLPSFIPEFTGSSWLPSFSPEYGPLHRRRIAIEIENIENRLDFIAKTKKNFRLRNDDGIRRQVPNERSGAFQQGHFHDPARIFGRDGDLNELVKVLTADSREVPGLTAIWGAAGIGKTTLARLVYHDCRVVSHFRLKVWVHFTEGSNVTSITKEIYEKMSRKRCNHEDLGAIQGLLRDYLNRLGSRNNNNNNNNNNNKFLIVIDNLSEESFFFLEILRVPLLAGENGSKVLITTRNDNICRLMSTTLPPINLKGLEDKQCWHLLCSLALPMGIEGQDGLVRVGKEIAKRCYGSPLTAKVLGALLNGKDEEEWKTVSVELCVLKQDSNGIVPSLRISYHHLPYPIKKCFAYCCIFPNGYLFEKDQLIRYWLAEGLIPYEGRRRLEHIGSKFFDELTWRSFFERIPTNDKIKREKYRIPSLMHDLARSISKYEFVDLQNNISGTESEAGHFRYASLSYRDDKAFAVDNAYNFKRLRTLILCNESKTPLMKVPSELLPTLTCLRVLDLGNSELTELPEIADDQLFHLRYLGLYNTKVKKIPESVCKLYNLQTLQLSGCTDLVELPEGIGKLINLRHLGLHINWENITTDRPLKMPRGINNLSSLQTLSRFTVASFSDGTSNICELEYLALRGDLCILNIENVQKPEDASKANLQTKQYIENLMLRWNESANSNHVQWSDSRMVMKNLQPSDRLRCLWVINYPGTSFPNWIGDASFSSLETIRISNCNNFNFLQLLGQLPRLKNLQIDKIQATTMSGLVGFLHLEHLMFLDLPFLEKLILDEEIPKLEKVCIMDCPRLKELVIHHNLHSCCEIESNCVNMSVTRHIPSD